MKSCKSGQDVVVLSSTAARSVEYSTGIPARIKTPIIVQ
jgi:hypothetical protein